MKEVWKLGVPAAMLVVAASVGAMSANRAHAGEYCRTDVTAHMTSCPYSTMEQCQMTRLGNGGDCFRDPTLPGSPGSVNSAGNNANTGAGNNANTRAFAYQPKGTRGAHRGRYGQAASPD